MSGITAGDTMSETESEAENGRTALLMKDDAPRRMHRDTYAVVQRGTTTIVSDRVAEILLDRYPYFEACCSKITTAGEPCRITKPCRFHSEQSQSETAGEPAEPIEDTEV